MCFPQCWEMRVHIFRHCENFRKGDVMGFRRECSLRSTRFRRVRIERMKIPILHSRISEGRISKKVRAWVPTREDKCHHTWIFQQKRNTILAPAAHKPVPNSECAECDCLCYDASREIHWKDFHPLARMTSKYFRVQIKICALGVATSWAQSEKRSEYPKQVS